VVLSVDEKSQIQALDRTQPGLPLKKGRAGTMTHDHKRHGPSTSPPTSASWLNAVEGFFAVLNQAPPQARRLQGRCRSPGRHQPLRHRHHNQQPKPFVWTAGPDKIIAAATQGHQTLDSIH